MLQLKALTPADLPKFEVLLGGPEFGGCFCAVWTSHGPDWANRCADPSRPNFKVTEARVRTGAHAGYLVYFGEEIVAWTGSGPKAAFPFLEKKLGSRLSPMDPGTWSVGCVAVAASHRGKGLAEEIVKAVIAQAREAGVVRVEAYPTRPWDEPRSFRGSERLYQRLGFVEKVSERDGESEILLMELALR